MDSNKEPTDDDLLSLMELLGENRLSDALNLVDGMIEKFPMSAKLLNIQGVINHKLNQFEAAINCYWQALKIKSDYAGAYNNMGNTFKVKGDFDQSIESFKMAILLDPNFAEAHNNMGACLQDKGDYSSAIDQFQKAIDIKQGYLEAYINKGNALRASGSLADSIECFKNVLMIEPNYADAYYFMGMSFREKSDVIESINCFKEVIKLTPNYFGAYNYLGNALKSIGQTEEAIKVFEKVLELKHDYYEVHRHLAVARKHLGSEKQIQTLLDLRSIPDLKNRDLADINFALGKIYDDLKIYDEAFFFLTEGNQSRKNELKYDIEEDKYLFKKIKERFKGTYEKEFKTDEMTDLIKAKPLFIVGMPRSGTTLIEQIISSHSKVYGAGELNFLGKGVENNGLVDLQMSQDLLFKLRSFYFQSLKNLRFEGDFITDKMPLNFRWCGFILQAIPEAKIIHVTRDSMATCFSIFKSYFSSTGNRYAYDLEDIVSYYQLYLDLMEFWRFKFPGKIYELNYESLTENQEKETRNLISFIGLNWEESCLNFHTNTRAVNTLSKTQVREKMYKGSSLNWKNYQSVLQDAFNRLEKTP